MGIMDEVEQLAASGRLSEAVALVGDRSRSDREAMVILGNWRLWGMYGPSDPAEAHHLFAAAAAAGSAEAALQRATLLNNGTGCPADPAAARSAMASSRPSCSAACGPRRG